MIIKKIFKGSLEIIISFINQFYNYKVHVLLDKGFSQIYSIWISKQFPQIGKGVHFKNKITLRGVKYIHINKKTSFGFGCILTAWDNYGTQKLSPRINIGEDSHFGEYNHITAINSITIGNGVLTGRWVTITDNAHGKSDYDDLCIKPHLRHLYSKGPILIEDNVWIGDKVSILPNVKIGKCSIIAANSVVTKDIPPYSIAAGIPAKVIKSLSAENTNGLMVQ